MASTRQDCRSLYVIVACLLFLTSDHQATSTPFYPSPSAASDLCRDIPSFTASLGEKVGLSHLAFVGSCQPFLQHGTSARTVCRHGLRNSVVRSAAVRRDALTSLRATLDAAPSAVSVNQNAGVVLSSTEILKDVNSKIVIRRAGPEEVEIAAALSMEAFFGLKQLDMFNASQVFRIYSNAEGEPYNAVQYLLQRGDLVRRLKQSTQQQSGEEAGTGGADGDVRGEGAKNSNIDAVFFAEDSASGKVVGMVELIALPYPAHPKPKKPYLFNLCVDSRWRSRGIGGKLVKRCEEEAIRLGHDLLWLHTETETTREIYSRLGYKSTYQQPSWVELNFMNKVVSEYDATKLRKKGWVIMARELAALL